MALEAPPLSDPSHGVFDRYFSTFSRLPGITRFGWRSSDPGVVHLIFSNADLARQAQNVLNDTVGGARLVIGLENNHAFQHATGKSGKWWDNGSNLLNVVAALPGVHDLIVENGIVAAMTTNDARVAALSALVRQRLGGYYVSFVHVPMPPVAGGSAK